MDHRSTKHALFTAALAVMLFQPADARCADLAADTQYTVAGLRQPAEIIVDHWGIPHIYAGTHYDAFFVQGFNAARDRLWQIDLWRRRGLGLLSEVLGADYVEQDRAARLFLYRGDMYREWLAYGSDAKQIASAFTAGINAYVEMLQERPELMPPEFALLGYGPARWQPEDVVRIRSHGLWRNVAREVKRARITCALGVQAADWWKVMEPTWKATVPEGLNPCAIPDGVLEVYLLATAPVSFAPRDGQATADLSSALQHTEHLGSNNWAVAPSRTSTGRPILADDPHRSHAVPSLRYIAHLSAPGLDVIGAGEPALPGISIGHNQRIAFGLTIFPIDQEDLYVYQTIQPRRRRNSNSNPPAYLYGGKPEALRVISEQIPVRGEDPRQVSLKFTRHGPVVFESQDHTFAVRAAWLEPGMAPYFGSIEYMRAQNWREFKGALNRWGAPSENQVFADIDGNIGFKPAGLFPRRTTWDGLFPVPGEGRFEWEGYFDMDALPEEFNPSRGFVLSANALNLPADYPIDERRVGFEWSAPWRQLRLWEVLGSQPDHTLTDSHDLQRDYQSVLARRLVHKLPNAARGSHPALAMLKNWNGRMLEHSAAAALFAVWYHRHLQPALLAVLPKFDDRREAAAQRIDQLDSLAVLKVLDTPFALAAATASLVPAWEETQALLGSVPSRWRWGDLHQIKFTHPLLHLATGELAELMAYRPHGRGGSANTPNNTGFTRDNFDVRSGASFRMVLDVGLWDDAEVTNAPGQSGDPRSPFYANLLEGWAQDSSIPLLYSRDAIEANEAFRVELFPVAPASQDAESQP